ncbi:MAG: GTPase HflX [Ignavibacteriales bacterium CG07_land_8_20_14_0_80_59_12]|nr:MAG: GTPase HflX [Ignavibacteriales bacterium CG07_land_8_20_14_0_80_59_12]
MVEPHTHAVAPDPERAIVVGVSTHHMKRKDVEEYLDELALLADTAAAEVVARVIQERSRIDSATFIGKGKVEELLGLAEELGANLIIFDDDLTPVQARNLEEILDRKVVDRAGLILDIFALRARTKEAMVQVELALLEYLLPRLTRRWTHLSKQYGGIGTRGPGEQQIEVDRRVIRQRISLLRGRLKEIARERSVQRQRRQEMPRVALVGYTNAGKSTLLNALAHADAFVEDRLFATLDPTVRAVQLDRSTRILLSDTVGFIRKLPPFLLASFKSTLDEVTESDLLLHVVDVSHPRFEEQISVVRETLAELAASRTPVIHVFNKVDRLADRSILPRLSRDFPPAVFISASRGANLASLCDLVRSTLDLEFVEQTLDLSPEQYGRMPRFQSRGEILEVHPSVDRVLVRFRARRADMARIASELKD